MASSKEIAPVAQLSALAPVTREGLVIARSDKAAHPRIEAIPFQEAAAKMAAIVMQSLLYRGQRTDGVNVEYIASALVQEIVQEPSLGLRYLTFDEIRYAIRKAVLYEDVFVCVSSLFRAVVAYAKSEGTEIQKEVNEAVRKDDIHALKASTHNTMISAYTGAMLNRNNQSK